MIKKQLIKKKAVTGALMLLMCSTIALSGCGKNDGTNNNNSDSKDTISSQVENKVSTETILDTYYKYFLEHENDYSGSESGGMITVDKNGNPLLLLGYGKIDNNNSDNNVYNYMLCGYDTTSSSVNIIESWLNKKSSFRVNTFSDGLIEAYGYEYNPNGDGKDNSYIYDGGMYLIDNGKLNKVYDVVKGGDYCEVRFTFNNKNTEVELRDYKKYESDIRDAYKYVYGSDSGFDNMIKAYGDWAVSDLDKCILSSMGLKGAVLDKGNFYNFVEIMKKKSWNSAQEYWYRQYDTLIKMFNEYKKLPDLWRYYFTVDSKYFNNFEYIKDLSIDQLKDLLTSIGYPSVDDFNYKYINELNAYADNGLNSILNDSSLSNYDKIEKYINWYFSEYEPWEEKTIEEKKQANAWKDAYNQYNLGKNTILKIADVDKSGIPYMFVSNGIIYHYENGSVKEKANIGKPIVVSYSKEDNIIKCYTYATGIDDYTYYDTANNFNKIVNLVAKTGRNDNSYYINNKSVSKNEYDNENNKYSNLKNPITLIDKSKSGGFSSFSSALSDYESNH